VFFYALQVPKDWRSESAESAGNHPSATGTILNGSALGYISAWAICGREIANMQTVGRGWVKGGSRLEKAYGWDGHPPFTLCLNRAKATSPRNAGGPIRAANSTPIYMEKVAPILRNFIRTTVFTRFFFAGQLPPFPKPIQTPARNNTYTRHAPVVLQTCVRAARSASGWGTIISCGGLIVVTASPRF